MAMYFNEDTDKHINEFNEASSEEEKHRIFNEGIRPAFEKLIENLIFLYGFYTIDDVDVLKGDCLTNLYEMLPKFDASKGSKGFSYFNVVAKNWFIQKTREWNKRVRQESELLCDVDHESVKNDINHAYSGHDTAIENSEFWKSLSEEMDFWMAKLQKKSERQVLGAVIFIMNHPDLVSIYNKKAVYLYLRELTGLNTKQVVMNLKKIKALYDKWKARYDEDGE